MSVWKAACYRDDALQHVCNLLDEHDFDSEFVRSLCDFDIDEPGNFALPAGIVAGNLRKQVERNPTILRNFIDRTRKRDPANRLFADLTKTLGTARFGIHGVYRFVADNWHVFTSSGTFEDPEAKFYETLFHFGYAGSYRTAREGLDKAKTTKASLEKYVLGPAKAIRELIKIGTAAAGPVHRREVWTRLALKEPFPAIERNVPAWLRRYDVYWWKSLLILCNPGTRDCYVFTRDDINRIERLCMGLAWCGVYFAEYTDIAGSLHVRLEAAYNSLREIIRNVFRGATKRNANHICRAFDVCLWYYLARQTTDVNSRALDQQRAKIQREGLGDIVNTEQVCAIAEQFKIREALELLQVYKAFPQPDFDYCGAAARQHTLYSTDKPYGAAAETENTGTVEDLWRYFRYTLLRSFHAKHGVCPGVIKGGVDERGWHKSYPYIPPEKIPPDQVDDIDMANTFKYQAHGTDILEMVKDKAICPVNVADYESAKDLLYAPVEDKNQLMDILMRKDPIFMPDLNRNNENVWDDVKADDKPEAKKPNGRWFFEAHSDRRLIQSEYEASVAEYGKTTSGCMAGKGTRDKIAAMNYICELPKEGTERFYRPLFVSFDLDKFSPMLGMDYHARSDKILSELFGQAHLAEASRVYTNGNVHYIKRRVHHTFPKMGRDFEGFSGRKNTIYHCAVMGYCVKRLRALKLVKTGGRFVSLIDDGLLRVDVDADSFEENVPKILKVIEEVYRMANLYISWDKTFVSSKFAVFLNEYYMQGTPITPGIRSFLKLTNYSDAICPSMLDDLAILESTARGAIAAGSSANIVYAGYCYYVMDTFRKWARGTITYSQKLALAAFSPVALGGFAVQSVNALSGSVSGPAIAEGIGALRAIAVRFKMLAPQINQVVNVKMRQISPQEKLRAPLAVRREGRTLKVTRSKQVIEGRLRNMLDTPVIRSLLGEVSVRATESVADALVYKARVPVELLTSVYNSSIDAVLANISAKFLRARTAFKLVPPKAFFRATIANITEARELIREWDTR